MTAARCVRCAAELPGAFPGAAVTCRCGVTTTLPPLPPPPANAATGGGPYRAGAASAHDARPDAEFACPYCANACPALARICPHCDVRLDTVRCVSCFSLQPPGAFACARCGRAMELEPLLDATDAPCPRCRRPLEIATSSETGIHECPRCGGMFVGREPLAHLLARAERGGALREPDARRRALLPLDQVTYLPCPLCHGTMNRVNFGRISGVIVDVCKKHGTWFDGGELTRIIAFAAGGGLAKTRARELADRKDEEARLHEYRTAAPTGDHQVDVWSSYITFTLFS